MEIFVENIKCAGCMTSITKAILAIKGTANVQIDKELEKITLDADETIREQIVAKLYTLGYPEVGKNNLFEKAKSYVSCAVGKMSN